MLNNIKSSFFIKIIFSHIKEKRKLKIIRYNKRLQKNIDIYLINYKVLSERYLIYENNGIVKEFEGYNNELKFEGEISDVGVDTIKLNRTIKISGDAILNNISIDVKAKDVVISGITINQNKGSAAITVFNASGVTVDNTKINFNANPGSNGFAINAELADNLKLLNNIIAYAGATTSWEVNNAIRVSSSNNVAVSGNKIKAKPWFHR